jgi:hypothetical protein
MSQIPKGSNPQESVKNENYISVLKKENSELDNKLKKVNQLVSQLKSKISENEKEKNLILTVSNKKELDLQNIKKQLEQTKSKVDELKNKNKQELLNLANQNDLLKNKSEMDINTIAELQQKITNLEFKLKSSSSTSNTKKFPVLFNTHNFSLVLEGGAQKNEKNGNTSLTDILKLKFENKNDNLFLTGRNELIEMKENNEKLNEQLILLQNELAKHQKDKNNLNLELEKYNLEKEKLMENLNKKNELLNTKMTQENQLNNNLMKQLIENKKIQTSLDNIIIKCKNLEKDKNELENVILEQENKVNELSTSIKKAIEVLNLKNSELNNNKLYIKNLEDIIRDLNKEFHNMRLKKKKENSMEVEKLKIQLEKLQRENQKLMEYNNKNIDAKKVYEFIPSQNSNYALSRNNKKKDKFDKNKSGLKKIKIKTRLNSNQTKSRIISSAMDISGFNSVQKRKNQDLIRLQLNKRKQFKKLYDQNYELSPIKSNIYGNFNRSKNLNIINLNNIKIKNLGNLKYNKSVLNIHKFKNINDDNNEINQINKELNRNIEKAAIKKLKIKNINTLNTQDNVSDYKISNNENTSKNYINQTKSSASNLIKLKNNNEISIKEQAEKEKIEEFKNFLQQIVSDIESK